MENSKNYHKETRSVKEVGSFIQVIKKNGKTHDKLFKDPQKAIRAVGGVQNVKYLREIQKEQVTTKYTSEDSLAGTPENEL